MGSWPLLTLSSGSPLMFAGSMPELGLLSFGDRLILKQPRDLGCGRGTGEPPIRHEHRICALGAEDGIRQHLVQVALHRGREGGGQGLGELRHATGGRHQMVEIDRHRAEYLAIAPVGELRIQAFRPTFKLEGKSFEAWVRWHTHDGG